MIDSLIHFSIRNKLLVFLMILVLIFTGVYSVSRLNIDALPDITNNQVQVVTSSPALAAQEVERFITFPIEMAVANTPDVEEIRSISRFGLSVVTIVFDDAVDIYKARQMVTEKLQEAIGQIPARYGVPALTPVSTGLGEIYQYTLEVDSASPVKYSLTDLRSIQDWTVRRQLLGTPGVADISSFGGYLKQYEVAINPLLLKSQNISISDVFDALNKNNQNTGGAYIDKKPQAYFIRGVGLVTSLEDIEKIVVKQVAGIPVLIKDIARVQYGHAVRYGALTRGSENEAVGAIVMMLKGENSSKVIESVKERIVIIQKMLPPGVKIVPYLDRTDLVDRAIHTVTTNLMEGGLIVVFVLVLFLGNLRAGLITASVIPLAMLFAITMMNLFGVSGNLMSLGAIDFGLIVDGAVIIIEAILHTITSNTMSRAHTGKSLTQDEMNEEVYKASVKIRGSAAFGEIIILIVYLPILSLSGIEGKMFVPMAQTVGFAIVGAFILSLTYVPMMASLFLDRNTTHKANFSDRMVEKIQNAYLPVLKWSLRNKKTVLSLSFGLMAIAGVVFSNMGGEFIPTLEEGDFAVETRTIPGSSLSETVDASLKCAKVLKENFPEVTDVVGKVGTSEVPLDPMPIEACDLIIRLKDKKLWTTARTRDELADKMNAVLSEKVPGVSFSFQQPIQMRFNELMTGAKQDVVIKIFGEDLSQLVELADKAVGAIRKTKGLSDLYVENIAGVPQMTIEYKRDKLAQYGINISDVNKIISMAFAGEVAGEVFEGEKRFGMVVRLDGPFREKMQDIQGLFVSMPNGSQVPVSELAEVGYKNGPMLIAREDIHRKISIGFNVRGRDVESIIKEVQAKLNQKLKLPEGYYITYGGEFEKLQNAKQRLMVAVPVALLLILILLYLTFNSISETLLIFTAVPMSAIGGIFALLIRGMPFSISAGVGFIALFGVAVLNGIVLIGYFNQLDKEGYRHNLSQILRGTVVRIRPVLMTATVASLGFLPMALSASSGAEVQKPLATVVIGGLISATILTLIVLPVLFSLFKKEK